jgi:16S rRNA (guanine527-N7)-methyltransferase
LTLDPAVRAAIEAHGRLLLAWNRAINLTALRVPEQVARLHVVDSLAAVDLVRRIAPVRPDVLDLGSGGGYPGLPLAAAVPAGRARLVESVAKKARFLAVAAAAVNEALRNGGAARPTIETAPERAEAIAARPDERGAWDIVTCRAVGSLAEDAELALPFLRRGGALIAWKRDDGRGALQAELAIAAAITGALGAGAAHLIPAPADALPGHVLVVLTKERPTPVRFPRSPAERRRPLLR